MSAAALRAQLDQAVADAAHLRLLVAERKAPADALHVAEYHVACLRRRLADLATERPRQGRGEGVAS